MKTLLLFLALFAPLSAFAQTRAATVNATTGALVVPAASVFRSANGLAIGTDVQAFNASLAAIAGNTITTLSLGNVTMNLAGLSSTPLAAANLTGNIAAARLPANLQSYNSLSSSGFVANLAGTSIQRTFAVSGSGASWIQGANGNADPTLQLDSPLRALASNTSTTLSFGNITASFAASSTLRSNASGVQVFANGAALLSGTPDYAGQMQVALDGYVAFPRTAATGHTGDSIVFGADVATFVGAIKPNRIDAISTAPQFDFAGGAHRLSATGTFQDNVLVLENGTTGGFCALVLSKRRGYPEVTFGTKGTADATKEYNGCYIATSTPDGIISPVPIGLYQEEIGGGRTHRRIYCDYDAKTVTCYGLDTGGAIVGGSDILVTDPVGWRVNLTGAMGIGTSTLGSGDALTVAGSVRVGSSTGPRWISGSGTPEAAVTAPVGSLFSRTDGGAGTSFYVKESGAGNTGWVAK